MNDSPRNSILLEILLVVGLITLCGALGFYHFEKDAHLIEGSPRSSALSFGDCVWWALVTVTTIGYGDIYPVTATGRIIAVFLMFGGIGALGVTTAAIAAYFIKNDQLQLLRLRRLHDHVVICGLGDKGLLLAKSFREHGQQVVVIEQAEGNDLIPACEESGAILLMGDATDEELLRLAQVPKAKYLIAVCGDDGTNAEVAAHARELVGDQKHRVLTCSTHIVNPELWYLLRKWEVAKAGSFRLQFFNVFDIGARALLNAHPPFSEPSSHQENGGSGSQSPNPSTAASPAAASLAATAPHLLVVGAGKLGQSLIVHAARGWLDKCSSTGQSALGTRLRVTMIDKDTARVKEFLHLRHPELAEVCEVDAHAIDIESPEFHRASFLFDSEGRSDVTAVYVCVDGDALALSAALSLFHRFGGQKIPIIVRMTHDAGLATLLNVSENGSRSFGTLHAVGLLERICQPDLVLGGTNEMLARAIHDKYVSDQTALGQTPRTNPFMAVWDRLPEEAKESNRGQADHISEKLRAVGCDIAPLTDWNAASFTFAADEIELMAKMEHARWTEERRAQGWTLGPRDLEKKTNPSLVPWEQLSDDSRDYNRNAVRELPAFLARAGFQIYRLK